MTRPRVKKKPTPHEKLATYREKRDFSVTPEPSGEAPTKKQSPSRGVAPRGAHPPERGRRANRRAGGEEKGSDQIEAGSFAYLIQKHAARRLHYDFRLELDGVLLSWAVPKGPSLDPKERRLAVRTEDHPIDYGDFEGVIPAGEYGGGTVMLWDRGTWEPIGDGRAGLEKGHLELVLHGERLRGRFHLVRTHGSPKARDNDKSWLLFKGKDEEVRVKDQPVDEELTSVTTGRTMEEIADERDRTWRSNRSEETKKAPQAKAARSAPKRSAVKAPAPALKDLVKQIPTSIAFTNLEKVLYQESGLTKAALLAYYAVVEPLMMPLVASRPLTLVRCPNGASQHCFFQKHAKDGVPKAIHRVPIEEDDGEVADYMAIDDRDGLLAAVQLGSLELHTWGCHVDKPEKPDLLVMDLDPDPTVPFARVIEAALEVRALLEGIGLDTWVKTTGGKGLHVCVPIARRIDWDQAKAFTKGIAETLVDRAPDRYTANMAKAQRKGKIFVDYLRNGRGATAIAPYSTRARAGAPVATPLDWTELDGDLDPLALDIRTLPDRIDRWKKDPWKDFVDCKQTISAKALAKYAR